MQVIVVASRNSGAGKTTLAAHLAVEAERQGGNVVAIMDTDLQGGLAAWFNAREASTPVFVKIGQGGLAATLDRCAAAGVDFVFIDTPPAISESVAYTLAVAHLVVVPARPSPHDLRLIKDTIGLVEAAGKRMVFVINAVTPRVQLTAEVAIALSQHGTVASYEWDWDRADYAGAMIDGRTAPEFNPTGPAACEVARLWTFVNLRLHERWILEEPASHRAAWPRRTQLASPPPEPPSSRAGDILRPPLSPLGSRVFDKRERPARTARVQIGLRLNPKIYERLRRMAHELRMPVQSIVEEMLVLFMDEYESGPEDS